MFVYNNKEIGVKNNQQSGAKTPTNKSIMNSNNMMLKPLLQIGQNMSDNSNMNNISGSNAYHKVAANLFTNQLQSQQQQQQLQQQHQQLHTIPQTMQQKYLLQQPESSQPPSYLYESIDYKIASHSSPYHHHINNLHQPQMISQSSAGRNQSPYSGNNSYLFNNPNTGSSQPTPLLLEKTVSLLQNNSNNQQSMQLSANPGNNYLNNSMNQGSVKCHSATSIQFELRDLQQERLNMKMMSNFSGTEENSPMQLRTADRFNFHKQRELSKGRQASEDQNRKMHQTINELEGEWNKIKKNHNLDNRSSSPFNSSLNNSTINMAKISSGQMGQQRLSEQLNRDQWNTQISDNNSIHDQSYDNTIKTQGSIKSLTSSCKRVRTQGDYSNGNNNSLNKIVHTPSRKQKDQSASSIKKTQIINKSIPLSKINLDQMRTNSYSSRSQGEQVTQYTVKKDSRQNSSQLSNRNSLNNSNSLISTNTNTNNPHHQNQHSSIQNKSPISRNSSQDEFSAPKSPDSTFLKIQEKYSNVHKQKTLSKHQDSSNQSINLSQSQQNNSQYLGYNNQQQQLVQGSNNYSNTSNSNFYNQMQQSDGNYNQQYQKNSFSDLSVSPHQSQIISQYSQNNIGNGCSTLHQYPSILSQASTYQNPQSQQFQQPQSSPLPVQRYASLTNNNINNNLLSSQNDLGNQGNNPQQDQSDIFHFNTQASGASPFNNSISGNQNLMKSPASYRSNNQAISYSQNPHQNNNHHSQNNSVNHSDNNNFVSKQMQPNVYKNKDIDSKPQLHSGPSSMQQIQLTSNTQPINYLQSYLTSQTTVNTPNCANTKMGQYNRHSEQIPLIQQQLIESQIQNKMIPQAQQPVGFTEAVSQTNKQHQQISSSKEKQIIQPVRASPMKKMIADVKPHPVPSQSPKQNGLIKGIQGSSNNNSLNTYNNSSNLSYAPSNSNSTYQQNLYQNSSGKKDMTQLIMNKIKKMNVARISLNEEDDLFFQSTDTDSYNNINSSSGKNQMNMKSRVSNNIINMNPNNNNDYLQQLQSQEMDHIHKTIQLQQMQSNQHQLQSDYDFSMQDTQSNNIETFSSNPLTMNLHKDTVSPRSVPQFVSQMSNNDPNRPSTNNNVLQNQKFFQTNQGNDKLPSQKTPEEVYSELMMFKQKSNVSPVKLSQIPSQQQENNTATSSFMNPQMQTKESFLAQQMQTSKPYIISQTNLQQTPINQKKLSNNNNYSQKLLDSIQKHAKTHQENQQNIYSTPSNNNADMKRGIGKVINNTIKKSQQLQSGQLSQPSSGTSSQQQSQQGHSQSQHLQMSQQVQLSLQPQLTTAQQQKVYNQALKSYQSTSSIQQPQNSMQVSQSQMVQPQQMPQKSNINPQNTYNFNLHSPIAKKIY